MTTPIRVVTFSHAGCLCQWITIRLITAFHLVVVLPLLHLLLVDLVQIQRTPGVEDVSQHEGDNERHVHHRPQRELARRTVDDRQRALQVDRRGVVSRVVPAGREQ